MSHSRSPILTLENAIAGSAFRIAPERESELAEWRDLNGLAIVLADSPNLNISVCLSKREITINIASLEFLWASAHAHLMLYDEYCKAQRQGNQQFDTGGNPRTRNALNLLTWATNNLLTQGAEPWPSTLPYPVQFPTQRSDVHVTNELFLCETAWIIHHEIAHIRLDHQPVITIRSIDEEKEADISATKWILDKSLAPQESRKRTFGIAAAILALQGINNPTQFNVLQTHPNTFERIDYCLTEADVPEDDEVYAFSSVIMQIQLAYKGVDAKFESGSFKDMFSEYLIEFARAQS